MDDPALTNDHLQLAMKFYVIDYVFEFPSNLQDIDLGQLIL